MVVDISTLKVDENAFSSKLVTKNDFLHAC